jgi:hypothetical protein
MTTIGKSVKEQLLKMISEKEKIQHIISFCNGYGFDITNYSSPVHIKDNKISIRYRRQCIYFYL